ncbi:MAG: FAD-dependent oxidoreductase [Deltaproteobacteria bacterium]|nr:FAD-dependent oxidoreductase [Deltaproteobacteria bacterium]
MLKTKVPAQEPPCKSACPAGVDVPRYVRFIAEGKFDEALAVIRERLPFPSVCGRVCVHPCEEKCNCNYLGAPIAIRALKRFVAERPGVVIEEEPPDRSTGRSVAIIGSGPAGLTAAYYLAKLGHSVTVFESESKPGGALRWAIPRYELPQEVVEREINNILGLGIKLETNRRVEDLEQVRKYFDAIFIAPGLTRGRKLNIPGADLEGVLIATEFLKDVNRGKEVKLGNKVLVLGGGGVALDAARTAVRLGVSEVHVACVESKRTMPALPEVIEEGEKEGIIFHPSTYFVEILGEDYVTGVKCLKLRWMKYDEDGAIHMDTIPESEHVLEADSVIFAVGQELDLGLISDSPEIKITKRGTISVDLENMATGLDKVFAGGDAVSGPSSIIEAVATGRKAAIGIDKYLGGKGDIDTVMAPRGIEWTQTELQGYPVGERVEIPSVPVEERCKDFKEVEIGYSEELAIQEAKRCLRCDLPITVDPKNCTGCLTCMMRCSIKFGEIFSPAIAKVQVIPFSDEKINEISFSEECDTCGICARYCPHDAIYRGERRKEEY